MLKQKVMGKKIVDKIRDLKAKEKEEKNQEGLKV